MGRDRASFEFGPEPDDCNHHTLILRSPDGPYSCQGCASTFDARERRPEPEPGTCGLCGKPLPEGEEMFKYHGYSGPCPSDDADRTDES